MEIVNCVQGTQEWFDLRATRMTTSHSQAIGNCGKGLETYIKNKMAEHYKIEKTENYTNPDMERGNDLEEEAGLVYAWETGNSIEKVGFVIQDDFIGSSPDLFANKNGMVEIKCPNDDRFADMVFFNRIDSKYLWQMQGQMFVCVKKWCDFVAYNPNFEKNIFIKRIKPDLKMRDKLIEGFKKGTKMITDIKERMDK